MAAPPEDPEVSAERMRMLLARWRQSLELHTRYLQLDDAHYWHVQPWPPHERPVPWIVQLARQKTAELARSLEESCARGDHALAVSLEQMAFLANLVGLQPAGRHIPLADPQNEQREVMATEDSTTREMPRSRSARHPVRAPRANRNAPPAAASATSTVRMPAPAVSRASGASGASGAGAAAAPAAPPTARTPPPSAAARQVMEDAARLLQWGRKWHELGELISRLSDRPPIGEARRILRTYRAQIEASARSAGP